MASTYSLINNFTQMLMLKYCLILSMFVASITCHAATFSDENNEYTRSSTTDSIEELLRQYKLPINTKVLYNEYSDFVLFTVDKEKDNACNTIKIGDLWVYNGRNKTMEKILRTTGITDGPWFLCGNGKSNEWPIDSITSVDKAYFNPFYNRLYIEYSDCRNTYSYIINLDNRKAIILPTNLGLMGITCEEEWLVLQSYNYYKEGGRYNNLYVLDWNGNVLRKFSLKKLERN